MSNWFLTTIATAVLTFGCCSCGSNGYSDEAVEPTEAELDDIDQAAKEAAEKITPESAEAEFEKLKKEMGGK